MNRRIAVVLVAFVVWAALTVLLPLLFDPSPAQLTDIMARGFGWTWMVAGAFILSVVLWQGWRDVALDRGASLRSWMLGWVPMVYITGAFGASIYIGAPPVSVLALVLVNCLFVGFSEELMFRGAILQAFRHATSIWPAVLMTSVAFGAIHSLNVFVTGELVPALVQSCAAFLSGLFFIAYRLRTGSLWPPILIHGMWDFATFSLGIAAASRHAGVLAPEAQIAPETGGIAILLPVLLVLPNGLYGLWLLRNIARTHADPAS